MSNPEKPIEYRRRVRDTKGVAQRLDLGYLRRGSRMLALRRRAVWAAVALAAAVAIPLVLGLGGTRRMVESGPLSDAHAIFENKCEVCHAQAFGGVPDRACASCHDGAPHPAKAIDTAHITAGVRCAECHSEHRGKVRLAAVADGNCTGCHSDLAAHASGVNLRNTRITDFRPDRHPEFSVTPDNRPLRLNHAIHMPGQARILRGMKLPMQCVDCHVPDRSVADGRFLPVTFEQNCKSCHARELEFDVYHLGVPPAPHAKDTKVIHEWIAAQYGPLAQSPLARRPLGNDLVPQPGAASWLDRVVKDSESYLFERKCAYCHVGGINPAPQVGRIAAGPALPRGEFNHRAHRAVTCESCHTQARTSTQTSDVLIPKMQTCTPCHGESGTRLDRCTTCHQFHNRSLEKDHARPVGELLGRAGLP